LKQGKLLTVDYGWPAEQFFAPEQTNGTLRAYHRHNANAGVLTHAGEQDLTAHVNFTQLQQAGEAVGLRTEGLFSQERFFTNLAAKSWQSESDFGHWTPARLRQFQTLTHPEHLGRPFSVLLQAR
jgi:SAM-dependent MidA family methyltransferase